MTVEEMILVDLIIAIKDGSSSYLFPYKFSQEKIGRVIDFVKNQCPDVGLKWDVVCLKWIYCSVVKILRDEK